MSQNRKNQGFSYYFCLMMEGSGSGTVQIVMDLDSGGPKEYPTDPQHCYLAWK
jgi:hypothetical protein